MASDLARWPGTLQAERAALQERERSLQEERRALQEERLAMQHHTQQQQDALQEERRGRRANANNPYSCEQCRRSYSTPSNLRRCFISPPPSSSS